eukprot:10010-Hanusia_phi.AAC.1
MKNAEEEERTRGGVGTRVRGGGEGKKHEERGKMEMRCRETMEKERGGGRVGEGRGSFSPLTFYLSAEFLS